MSRRALNMETKLASALLALGHIPYEHAKLMTAAQIISLYDFHHNIYAAHDGGEHFSNLEPIGIIPHRRRTAEIDRPAIAKVSNAAAADAVHRTRLASKGGDYEGAAVILSSVKKESRLKPKRRIPSRPFPRVHRPMRGRSSFARQS